MNLDQSSAAEFDAMFMARALELAARGEGYVEPNPMVGCVVVLGNEVVGEGWHRKFGGPHAEIEALEIAGPRARGATMYVTLEPCCHQGKTPPCTEALVAAGVARVVCAQRDPFPEVAGRGVAALEAAGIAVEVGLMEAEAKRINAPYLKLIASGLPWTIAKWAMTLDGKIATAAGDSQWISSPASREIVQQLRGRVDAIMVGHGTAHKDNPLLMARPKGARRATRIVADSMAALPLDSQLVRSAGDAPVLVAVGPDAPPENIKRLSAVGCEVIVCGSTPPALVKSVSKSGPMAVVNSAAKYLHQPVDLAALLRELGQRRMTNVLVEGGGKLLGALFDAGAIDEVHVFLAPKLAGGLDAPTAVAGKGVEQIASALQLANLQVRQTGEDVYVSGRMLRGES